MEFALVYANDWFVIPVHAAGRHHRHDPRLRGHQRLRRAVLDRAGRRRRRRRLAALEHVHDRRARRADAPADTSLLLLPTVAEDPARARRPRRSMLIRDEVANMVWGDRDARSRCRPARASAASRRRARRARSSRRSSRPPAGPGAPPPHVPPPAAAPIRYQVMTTVPENWIPFIPVHVPGEQPRDPAAARGAAADPRRRSRPPVKVQPRTVLLREGLDRTPAAALLRARGGGAARRRAADRSAFQRTRWSDGRVYTWLRVRRQTGRGEGSSGLGFDKLVDVPVKPPPG